MLTSERGVRVVGVVLGVTAAWWLYRHGLPALFDLLTPLPPSGTRKKDTRVVERAEGAGGVIPKSNRRSRGRTEAVAVERLLPNGEPPAEVTLFFHGASLLDNDRSQGGGFHKQVWAAATWLLDALCHAHEDPAIKAAARRLFAVEDFTVNLDVAEGCFLRLLRPGLKARLVELGATLEADHQRRQLDQRFSDRIVLERLGAPENHPLVRGSHEPATTADGVYCYYHVPVCVLDGAQFNGWLKDARVLPCDPNFAALDFAKPWTFPEDIYAHALLMVAAAIDSEFQSRVAAAVTSHNTAFSGRLSGERDSMATAEHIAAPTKAFARVMTKAASDYRGRQRPVSQHNLDVLRCLVSADSPEELLSVAKAVVGAFGGPVKIKNLSVAPGQERVTRFHMLPLMVTVQTDAPNGAAFAEYMAQPDTVAAIDAYVAARDPGVAPHRWAATTAAARQLLQGGHLATVPVRLLGEVQLILSSHARVRDAMHEVYKAYRAESAPLLYEDFTRSTPSAAPLGNKARAVAEVKAAPTTVWLAAHTNNLPALERIVARDRFVDLDAPFRGALFATSPLYEAAGNGATDVVKFLVDRGADVDAGMPHTGASPLYIAAQNGHVDAASLLVAANADVHTQRTDADGATALFAAAQLGYLDIVQLLLGARAKVDAARRRDGATPLFITTEHGHREVAAALLAASADPNRRCNPGEATGNKRHPLHAAAQADRGDLVKLLVSHNAECNPTTQSDGSTPLVLAAARNHRSALEALVAAGADVNSPSIAGVTPLYVAAQSSHLDAMDVLITHGAGVNDAQANGATPIVVAAQHGHTVAVEKLIAAGADPGQAGPKGITPLIMAALHGHVEVVAMLLRAGVPVNARTIDGHTALTIAIARVHLAIAAMLRSHGGTQ